MFENLVIPQIVRRFDFEEWGGTESVVWESSKKLKSWGVQPEILSTQALNPTATEEREGLQIQRFDYHYPYWGLTEQNRRQLDKKGGNPFVPAMEKYLLDLPGLDLLHSHGMQRIAGLVRRVAQKRKIPYVVSFHGGNLELPNSEIEQMRSPVKGSFHFGRIFDPWYGTDKALAEADALICVGYSEYLKTQAAYPNQRVVYLPNGVEPARFAQAQGNRFKQQYGIPPELRLLLCVGRIDPQKNQAVLLELLPELPENTGLVLIGPPTAPGYQAELEETIRARGLSQRVWLIPGLNADEPLLADAYDAAEIFVLPSRHEPFGIVVLEAWMRRKPVLVADLGGLQHLVNDGVTGLRFGNTRELVQSAKVLLQEPAFAQLLGESGYHEALLNYSWETVAHRLYSLYLELVQENSHSKRRIA